MTELKAIIDNQYLLVVLVASFSAIGSFLGGYLKQRGQQRAQTEDFKEIRKQLTTTTRDTEEIKQHLSKTTWLTQQQWIAREKYYVELLGTLYRFKITLESLFDYYLEPGAEHTPDNDLDEAFHNKRREAAAAYAKAENLLGAAALYLSSDATKALETMFEKHWELTTFEASCTHEYIEGASKMAQDAYRFTLEEARRQLQLPKDA